MVEKSSGVTSNASGGSHKSSRQVQARIFLLDDSVHTFSINSCALGSELFQAIIDKQNVIESDYFDLEYVNSEGVRCWLDHNKSVMKQVGVGKDLVFIFAVKFYTPHPNLLEEEYTRYLFALQIKRDLVSGQLICSTNTAALLASYIVQAEIGDFLEDEYLDNCYLRPLKIVNQPNDEILNKIMEFHKNHVGISPTEADFHLLDTARKIEYYGVKMHLAKDHENLPLNLSVTHMGIVVFQNLTKINTFSWAKIRKLSFKRKKFLIKLHPEGYGYYKGMVEFYFETRDDCKRFWKKCIEHHSFFRCPATDKSYRKKPKVVTKGSSFRYCGRTQKELVEYVRENYSSKRDNFIRPSKARVSKSPHNPKHNRHGKSNHPFAIKSSYSAPSRAVSDGSDLDRTGMSSNAVAHTPRKQRSVSNVSKSRWSQSAGHSPREDLKDHHRDYKEMKTTKDDRESSDKRNSKEYREARTVGGDNNTVPSKSQPGSQKRSRKGRKFIQVSRTGSSADEDDDKRVTASEMSLSSSGCWWDSVGNGPVGQEDPLPAKEAFKGVERLTRQRASYGGFGDVSDSDQQPLPVSEDRARPKPVRQASEPLCHKSPTTTSTATTRHHEEQQQQSSQKVICIDQYRNKRHEPAESLPRSMHQMGPSKLYKSTPNDVSDGSKRNTVGDKDSREMLTDIPYVLLRRHKTQGGGSSVKSTGQSRRSLASKSLKSVRETADNEPEKEAQFTRIRHSKSLDRRLVGADPNARHIMTPKSPKLLREEYMQSQRKNIQSNRATIEALKNQLRSTSTRSIGRITNGEAFRGQPGGPMFVSAYRLPPVNNFSAKDDTMSPQSNELDRLYSRIAKKGNKTTRDANENDGDDEVDLEDRKIFGQKNIRSKLSRDKPEFSDSDDSQLKETADIECLLDLLPGNPIYLNSSSSSENGEFDISPDRFSRPRSVSENEFRLRTPRSSRRSSLCRGHNSSLSLTDSSFNSDASFDSEEADMSGSPYSFLADCGQQPQKQHRLSSGPKNGSGSSGDSPQLPDDEVPHPKSQYNQTVDLQILQAPQLSDDSTEEPAQPSSPPAAIEHCNSAAIIIDIEQDEQQQEQEEQQQEKEHSQLSESNNSTLEDEPEQIKDESSLIIQRSDSPLPTEICSPLPTTTDRMSIDDRELSSSSSSSSEIGFSERSPSRSPSPSSSSSSSPATSDKVVIVTKESPPKPPLLSSSQQPDVTAKESKCIRPKSPMSMESVSQILETMLQKRLTESPFVRTSTPNNEYAVTEKAMVRLPGSSDKIHQQSTSSNISQTGFPSLSLLKSAKSAPGLVSGQSSYSPLPAYLRRPFTSSSSSSSDSSSSIDTPATNPFFKFSNNPFVDEKDNTFSVVEKGTTPSKDTGISSSINNNNNTNNNNYEQMFEQSMPQNNNNDRKSSVNRNSPIHSSFGLRNQNDRDESLVFHNEGALSSISVGKSPTEQTMVGTFQETVEGNLMCYESSEHASRPHSLPDEEEEPDEYVLPSDHKSFSTTTSASSQESSDSGQYQAQMENNENFVKQTIPEQSDTTSSASEGSEDIEPFPPPPPPSDLIFDERDEDIFQQMQQRTICGDNNDVSELESSDILPQLDITSPSSEFPQPPPPIISSNNISNLKEELSSSEVPSLFGDYSGGATTSGTPNEEESNNNNNFDVVDDNQPENEGNEDEEEVGIVEETIIPQHCSLLFDEQEHQQHENDHHDSTSDDIILQMKTSTPNYPDLLNNSSQEIAMNSCSQ